MSTYRLISFKTCPWVQRAAIVLREKQVPFEFVHIEPGKRPDWFAAVSPHGKVPVLQIDEDIALFESNAIAEYLDDTIQPRLQPDEPIARAINRAWTDYLPTFSAALGALAGAKTQSDYDTARDTLVVVFQRLESALARQGSGPYFNGDQYTLVDAGYAPFLQRHLIVERLQGDPISEAFPRLDSWAKALVGRASTHTFPPEEFEALYRENLKRRGSRIVQPVEA